MAKSKKELAHTLYALIDVTMGDSLASLITCSPCSRLLIDASRQMHLWHPDRHDFAVLRSTDLGYFGKQVKPYALNGELITE